jgi:hypothetical protein
MHRWFVTHADRRKRWRATLRRRRCAVGIEPAAHCGAGVLCAMLIVTERAGHFGQAVDPRGP